MEIIFIITAIFSLYFDLCLCMCARSEYETDGECCPMCAPGNRVYRHCTKDEVTTCVPCPDSRYIDTPNGLMECFNCTRCDHGQGLRVKTPCTCSSNTVCEPLEGYHCTGQDKGSCIYAQRHTNCSPGQYIHQKGTAFKDTECAKCAEGTFSNGFLQTCQPHSKCEDRGLTEINAGTLSTDTECGNKTSTGLIAGIIGVLSFVLVGAVGAVVFLRINHRTNQPAAGNNLAAQDNPDLENITLRTRQETRVRVSEDLALNLLGLRTCL